MMARMEFYKSVQEKLSRFDPEVLRYDESEFWMIRSPYEYIEHYAMERRMLNTCIALPLARGLHDGVHRKSSIERRGVSYRLPYVIHCLLVCRMLVDLHIPITREEKDVLLASALCHDMIEDIPFANHGEELTTVYGLDPQVHEIVKLVSKRRDFTEEEELQHFREIAKNKLAMLVKLSDRSHNVEDLYNMKFWKVHEYVNETNRYFDEMCRYGLRHYPELTKTIEIMFDKIFSLTRVSETMVQRCEARERELEDQLKALQEENAELRRIYRGLWEE